MRFHVLTVLFLLACSSSKPADPNRRLTKAECAEGVDHVIALFEREPMPEVAKSMRDGRAGFIAQCEATALAHDHACLMKSKTAHDLGLCPMPGTPVGGAR